VPAQMLARPALSVRLAIRQPAGEVGSRQYVGIAGDQCVRHGCWQAACGQSRQNRRLAVYRRDRHSRWPTRSARSAASFEDGVDYLDAADAVLWLLRKWCGIYRRYEGSRPKWTFINLSVW
jgi:hypothetical protein